ncbi:MAG: hypothetical protein PHX13_12265 [Thiovulaceae bacterium]|nr:hypothetical protein [Sulfurimonadaceae bacterium]
MKLDWMDDDCDIEGFSLDNDDDYIVNHVIEEMPIGTLVKHNIYGVGRVVGEFYNNVVEVNFGGAKRRFLKSYLELYK